MKRKLLIRGGLVWSDEGAVQADVLVGEDGRVLELIGRTGGEQSPAGHERDREAEVFEASGHWVLPGAVDAHVHFRDPGMTEKEDFATGSKAAVLGGVTTVLDMPNTAPPVADRDRLKEKLEIVSGRSYVDYGLFTAAVADDEAPVGVLVRRVAGAVREGAIGVKVFLGPTTGDIRAPDWGGLLAICSELAGETVFTFHCEDRDVIAASAHLKDVADPRSYRSLLEIRPRFGELLATNGALCLAEATGARVHIAHVALREAVRSIEAAKAWGAPVTAETCPQYLFLTEDDYAAFGSAMKVLPPIRSQDDQGALWEGLAGGVIDLVATDHAPHRRGREEGDVAVWDGSFGMSGVQTLLPLMIDAALQGRCSAADVVRWTSANPARAYGLFPRKGRLEPGSDADIAVVDPGSEWRVDAGRWASKSRNTAFWGRSGMGKPVATFVRGRLTAFHGDVVGKPLGEPVSGRRL